MPADLLSTPLRGAEFLAVDTETNGRGGPACELTEIGAVLVGGGELHDTWETLVAVRAPLSRGIQRFTGISQAMVDGAPPAEATLPDLSELLDGRVLVAHSASFDVRVLRQACERASVAWPDPPVLCTVALARRLLPLARQRGLRPLAESLGIEVDVSHRALADAETCARVFCAMWSRLASQAADVGEAVALCRPVRRARARGGRTDGGVRMTGARRRAPDTSGLPDAPGVYVFRNAAGQVLYVGKSVRLRARARAHFSPSSPDTDWVTGVEVVDHVETASELEALLVEHELITSLRPPGNVVRKRPHDGWVWIRCRLDIAFPVLEVAPEPAPGRAVHLGPLRARSAASELIEQVNSLFELRHCGRGLPRRQWPSAYGQMGRCLSPCLQDLDPNLYRRRLDAALAVLGDGGGALLAHVDAQMRSAAVAQAYERAAWLRRRHGRLAELLARLGGSLSAEHRQPRLIIAEHPAGGRADLAWIISGRVVERAPARGVDAALARSRELLRAAGSPDVPVLTPSDAALTRVATTWAAANEPVCVPLSPEPDRAAIASAFARAGVAAEIEVAA